VPHGRFTHVQRNRAKQLRQKMTRAETLLWRYLKAHHMDGLAFRRQAPIGQYIADFIWPKARLVIEVDGSSHDFEARQLKGRRRDEWFASQQYVVLHFTNEQVSKNLYGVIEIIREMASTRLKRQPPSLALPHKGGGNERASMRLQPPPSLVRYEGGGNKDVPIAWTQPRSARRKQPGGSSDAQREGAVGSGDAHP
jgi:very-short-patch-repair endonuclease